MSDDIDTLAPRTIKAVSNRAWNLITAAAKREGLTVAGWLERRVLEWEADGSPVPVSPPPPPAPVDLVGLAAAMQAMKDVSAAAGVQVPPQLAKDSQAAVRVALRQAKGLPPRAASKAKPVQALQASIGGA